MSKFIKEYKSYNTLKLPRGIILNDEELKYIKTTIYNAIHTYYNFDRRQDSIIEIDGLRLKSEYLSKAAGNYRLLRKLIYDEYGEINSGVNNKEELISFIKNNLYDLFHYKGKYFKYVYKLLHYSSLSGKSKERKSFDLFENVSKKRGVNIKVELPTVEQDLIGIDGVFKYNDKYFTIQVKPLKYIEEFKLDNTKWIVFCDGVLSQIKTDYLITTNDKETFIFRNRGIMTKSSYFLVPKSSRVL